MKLKSIEVRNYRSIVKTTRLELDFGLTVILGPNNEGKSNLLRAIVLAMECIRVFARPTRFPFRPKDNSWFRLPSGSYDWDADFPLAAQQKAPDGQSTFILEFDLNLKERKDFQKEIGSSINRKLPVEITVGPLGARIKVKKQGKAAQAYEAKSRDIARFVRSRFEFEYIPAIRPSQLSLAVVESLIQRELSTLESNPDYQSALKTIENLQRPLFSQLEADVETYLKKLLPSVRAVKINPVSLDGHRTRFRLPQFVVNDGTATELDAKGDGVKSLVAISLMRSTKAGGAAGDLVVAIEEPESHLHPEAIRELAIVLREMAEEHQVIITTHSPLLVARNRMEANIIVSNSRATPASSIKAVRDSLGVKVQDNLESAEYVILVEGESDVEILSSLFVSLSEPLAELIRTGKIVVDHLYGTGNIAYKVASLRLIAATPILILDDDKAGRDCAKKAKEHGGVEDRDIFLVKRTGSWETEIEDILDPDGYWSIAEKKYGAKLDRQAFDTAKGKWSDRMKTSFEKAGKSWSTSVESNLKKTIANCVSIAGESAIDSEWRPLLESITSGVLVIVEGIE